MSQENLYIVEGANHAFDHGDLDRVVSFYAPDAEVFRAEPVDDPEAITGREKFRLWLERVARRPSPGAQWVCTEMFAIDDDRVLNRAGWVSEGASGGQTASSFTAILTIRDGQISRVEYFLDHDKALKAVGLAE